MIAFAFCLIASIFAFWPYFFVPYVHGDEAAWMVLGREAFNGNLYVNLTDNKPPLFLEIYGMFDWGPPLLAFRTFLILWVALGGVVLQKSLKLSGMGKVGAMWAGIFFCLSMGTIEFGTISSERLYVPLLLMGAWFALAYRSNASFAWRPGMSILLTFGAGLTCGLSMNIKQPSVIFAVFVGYLIFDAAIRLKRGLLPVGFSFLGVLTGFFAPWILTRVPFETIWSEAFMQSAGYIAPNNWGRVWDILTNLGYCAGALFGILFGSLLALRRYKELRMLSGEQFRDGLVFILCSVATLMLGFRMYQTHYIVLIPLLASLAALGFSRATNPGKVLRIGGVLVVLNLWVFQGLFVYRQLNDQNKSWTTATRLLVKQIQLDTEPSDKIWVSNALHVAYAASERQPAVKHFCFQHTFGQIDICQTSEEQLRESLDRANYLRLIEDLQKNAPKVIFWVQDNRYSCAQKLKLENFPSIQRILDQSYREQSRSDLGIYYLRIMPKRSETN